MTTIDLGAPAPTPLHLLDGLPRRVSLTLPELQYCAASAGDAPLPFVLAATESDDAADPLADRLGGRPSEPATEAYDDALATLHDPLESLARRGLVSTEGVDANLLGAIGLLATPSVGVDIDVTVGGTRAKVWHRQRGEAVAALATVDGLVYELAWFTTADWPQELGRVPALPAEVEVTTSQVPERVDLPYELVDAAGEAVRENRGDLLAAILAPSDGTAVEGERALSVEETRVVVEALHTETRGRIRAMLADVTTSSSTIGVLSWVLLNDGWHALRPHHEDGALRVEIRRVEPSDFARSLAPVLAEVTA